MKRFGGIAIAIVVATSMLGRLSGAGPADQVKIANGTVEGTPNAATGVRSFKGIPFAAPPVGDLRWKAPQPVANWTGVRRADQFGPKCMQQPLYSDMVFRSNGMSEDCLYLNVWAPQASTGARLPVLVYFFGGGYAAGDGSEPRYDGENMARKGIVALTVNYRLGVFGFFAHPELTKESPHHSSGDYALLDHVAALRWVHDNIAAFGGDPAKVTIAGESAGSISVSALDVSPLSKGLIAGVIGESGAMINPTLPPSPLAQVEQQGEKFATTVNAASLQALRAMTVDQLLAASGGAAARFPATIDGWVLPKAPIDILTAGEQAHVPLLVGSNSEEQAWRSILAGATPTPENYAAALRKLYNDRADEALKLYPGSTTEEVYRSATELASDRFIAYSTWKWFEQHSETSGKPAYYYFYAHARPASTTPPPAGRAAAAGTTPAPTTLMPAPPRGASHSAEIEYAMGNLSGSKAFAWTPDDEKVSSVMQAYFANFIKTGNPNGSGLPQWPAAKGGGALQRMRIDVQSHAEAETRQARYRFLDSLYLTK